MKDIKIFLKKKKTRQKKAQERYQNFTEKEKERHNKNISEEQKKKLAEYRRNHYLIHKK